ncbi:MAG: glycosyltransferase family 39 protein [Planctomycetes bacterium]|nr:glycosyltransferase family 39 protein [Planctomycetota bacterium]
MTPAPTPSRTVPGVPPRALPLLAVFVVCALVLRIPLLSDSIWFDEACMSSQRVGTWEQLLATIYVDIHPPLYITFMHFWNAMFGDGEVSMRLPALIAGLASIPLTFFAGRRLVSDTAALWGAALLALSPVHIWYSAEARLYTPMLCCALLATYTFHRIVDGGPRPSRRLWLLHLANIAVMLALHYYLALYVVLLAMLAPLATRGLGGRAGRLLGWHGFGLMLLAGFVYGKQMLGEFETSQAYLRAMSPAALYDLLFDWSFSGHTLRASGSKVDHAAAWVQQGLMVMLTGFGLLQLWRCRRERPGGLYLPLYLLVIPGFLAASALFGLANTYIERSCLPALPFLFLLVGAGLDGLPRRLYLPASGITLVLVASTLISLYLHREVQWTVYKPKSDWRAAATWLGAEIDRGAAGRPVFTSMPNPRPLPYYDARIQDVKTLQPGTGADEIGRKVERRLGSWLGKLASDTFRRFDEHNARLLADAKLRVYRSAGDPAELDLEHRLRPGDDTCYLVRNEWHPHHTVDDSIERLLQHPRVTKLETHRFPGMTVYKVRVAK